MNKRESGAHTPQARARRAGTGWNVSVLTDPRGVLWLDIWSKPVGLRTYSRMRRGMDARTQRTHAGRHIPIRSIFKPSAQAHSFHFRGIEVSFSKSANDTQSSVSSSRASLHSRVTCEAGTGLRQRMGVCSNVAIAKTRAGLVWVIICSNTNTRQGLHGRVNPNSARPAGQGAKNNGTSLCIVAKASMHCALLFLRGVTPTPTGARKSNCRHAVGERSWPNMRSNTYCI